MFELVGIQDVNFADKDGKIVVGTKLHYLLDPDPETKARGFIGKKADSHFFRCGFNLPSSLSCGKMYDFEMTYNGGRYPVITGIHEVN